MKTLSKETLDIICEALSERSRITSNAQQTAPTRNMRSTAAVDFKETHKAWEEVESYKRDLK